MKPFSALRWGALVAALGASIRAQSNLKPEGEVIELPKYTVTDTRDLPQPEKWHYARIPGFEVLSNASERTTKNMLKEFQRFSQALDAVWPGVQGNNAMPAALIICGRGGKFEQFMPAGEQAPDRAMASISLRDREQAAIVIDYESKVINLSTPEGDAALAAAAANTSPDGLPSLGDPGFAVDAYKQLFREYIKFIMSRIEPRAPAWFEEGLAQIFMAMDITRTSITVGKVEDPNTISASSAAAQAAGIPDDSPQEDRDFNAALAHRRLMPMQEMFEVTADSDTARNPLGSTWAKQSYAFVHWGLYGQNSKHQKAFLTFLQKLATQPPSEALFKECFKMSYKDMLLEIRGYVEFTQYRSIEFRAKKGTKIPEPDPVEVRDATEAEVGRIKGDTLRLAGHMPEAHATLIAPYIRGERDPALLAALGVQERLMGDDARARKLLEAAAQGKAVRPRAYLELARMRFADATTQPAGKNGKFSPDQTAAVLTPLFTARQQPPPRPEVYELIADAWSHSEITPTSAHLGVVDEGVRMFPRDTTLVYSDAALKVKAGLYPGADSLVSLGLRTAPDAAMREKFEELKKQIPAGPVAPPPANAPASATPAPGAGTK